jgi:hypothetical protein
MKVEKSFEQVAAVAVLAGIALIASLLATVGCGHHGSNSKSAGGYNLQSSRAYPSHSFDREDINAFIAAYPSVWGTRLDDCQTCHWGKTVINDKGKSIMPNNCTYCHLLMHPLAGWSLQPKTIYDTLNPYGEDFLAAGRDAAAVLAIANLDSDGDGSTNQVEILNNRFPGNPNSKPGQPLCGYTTVTMAEIKLLPKVNQFTLANAQRQQYDSYANYGGAKIKDILALKHIPTTTATSIDIMAPDLFKNTTPITMDKINDQFPYHKFFSGLGLADLGATCGFIEYPADTHGLANGATIPNAQWHIIAYEREGLPLEPVYPDPISGKLQGEGPFRNVMPPGSANPAMNIPDRNSTQTPMCTGDGWDYADGIDHNAGQMVKGAVIIKIYPMPTSCEEFDLVNGGFGLVDSERMVIYGHSVQ